MFTRFQSLIRDYFYHRSYFRILHRFNFLTQPMKHFTRITLDPEVMGGKPCIRGLRVTVGMVVGLVSSGYSTDDILKAYPYLEVDDVREALAFAAWRVEEVEVQLFRAA